jgi:GntR family transcriptional regulator, transcriptional repressor for pyruvate dehydrogenase complex
MMTGYQMMTGLRRVSRAREKASDFAASLPPLAPRSLTAGLAERLAAEITRGKLAPGSRLPTEQEMVLANGVSRTVVREAVAALRADGLVNVRQGVGAFVAGNVRRPFRIDVDWLRSLRQALDVMELRTGIEIEAAGLAAERASNAQIRKIELAYEAIDRAIGRGESAIEEDFTFHVKIADATGNLQFLGFLQYLGHSIIPRNTVRVNSPGMSNNRAYLKKVQAEHRDILEAIRSDAPPRARAAMRRHLINSRKRYQKLAPEIREE